MPLQTLYVAIAVVLVHIILGLLASNTLHRGIFQRDYLGDVYLLCVRHAWCGLIKALNGSI